MKPIAWKLFGALAAALAFVVAAGCNTTAANGSPQCDPPTACGTHGGGMSKCVTNDANGVCASTAYEVGGQSFNCHSCLDCTEARSQAETACLTSGGGDGGTGSSSGASSGGGDCSAKAACGASGITYQECTVLTPSGACASIAYKTSDGKDFACAGCANCQTAAAQLSQYCSTSGGKPTTTCSSAIACGSGGVTYQQCTTTNAGVCESIQYRVSNGSVYTCASCGDCSSATSQLTSYCSSQGNPTTSCSSPTTCGSNGLTYKECTTYSAGSACISAEYQVSDGATYACAGCGNCTSAYDSVASYCASQGNPTTSCSSTYACGGSGDTYQYCTTTSGSTCDSVQYTTSTGYSWTCATCSDCSSAYSSVTSYCSSLGSTGQTCGSVTCGSAATCCYCTSAYTCISLSAGMTCASFGCQ
jgi:hypothetical protein